MSYDDLMVGETKMCYQTYATLVETLDIFVYSTNLIIPHCYPSLKIKVEHQLNYKLELDRNNKGNMSSLLQTFFCKQYYILRRSQQQDLTNM